MNHSCFNGFILILVFSLGWSSSYGQDTLTVADKEQAYEFSFEQIKRYQDHTHALEIQEVIWAETQNLFATKTLQDSTKTSQEKVYWLSFSINGTALKNNFWYWEASNPNAMQLTCYAQQKDGSFYPQQIEDFGPSSKQYFPNKRFAAALPQSDGIVKLFARLQSKHPEAITFQLKTAADLHRESNQDKLMSGLFYGILLMLGIYHLFLSVFYREKVYLYYSFFVLSGILWCWTVDGFGLQYLWSNFSAFNGLISNIAIFLFLISFTSYANSFLKLNNRQAKYFRFILCLTSLSLIYYSINIPAFSIEANLVLFISVFSLFLIAGFFSIRQNLQAAKAFFFANTFIWLSLILSLLISFNSQLAFSQILSSNSILNLGLIFSLVCFALAQSSLIHQSVERPTVEKIESKPTKKIEIKSENPISIIEQQLV